jgi:hypothetical protein
MKIITSDILGNNEREVTVPVLGVLCGYRISKVVLDSRDGLMIYQGMYSDSQVRRAHMEQWLNHLFSKLV